MIGLIDTAARRIATCSILLTRHAGGPRCGARRRAGGGTPCCALTRTFWTGQAGRLLQVRRGRSCALRARALFFSCPAQLCGVGGRGGESTLTRFFLVEAATYARAAAAAPRPLPPPPLSRTGPGARRPRHWHRGACAGVCAPWRRAPAVPLTRAASVTSRRWRRRFPWRRPPLPLGGRLPPREPAGAVRSGTRRARPPRGRGGWPRRTGALVGVRFCRPSSALGPLPLLPCHFSVSFYSSRTPLPFPRHPLPPPPPLRPPLPSPPPIHPPPPPFAPPPDDGGPRCG